MNTQKKLITIGTSVVLAFLLLFFGINYLKGINLFHTSNYFFAVYDDVTGLAVSAPVNANGFKVGQVREINYMYDDPGHVKVEMALDSELKVPEGTVAVLGSDILGTATITLVMPKSNKYAEVGSILPSRLNGGLLDNVSADLMPGIVAMIPKVDSLLVAVTSVVSDPAVTATVKRLDVISHDLTVISNNVSRATAPLPAVVNGLNGVVGNVNGVVGKASGLMDQASGVVGNVNQISLNLLHMSNNLDSLSNQLKGLPLDRTMQNVVTITDELKTTLQRLQNNESSLGMLLNDPELYNSLTRTVGSLDSLITDVKARPKRYLKFSVF